MKHTAFAIAASLAGVLAAASLDAQPARHAPFMIGVFAPEGGTLLPVARFSGTAWSTPWPATEADVPGTPQQIPSAWWPGFSANGWRTALSTGERAITIWAPTKFTTACNQESVALTANVAPGPGAKLEDGARIAATGTVTIRFVRSEGEYDEKTDVWSTGERLFLDALGREKRELDNVITTNVSRIPLQDGGSLWAIEAVGRGRHVRAWISQSKSAPFEFVDDREATVHEEGVGMLTPIGAIWGMNLPMVLAWRQGTDGNGGFVVVKVDKAGPDTVAGAGGC